MLKRTILTLLIPLPLMAFALATAMVLEFQKLPNKGANQLTPMEFVQLKASQLLQSQEARAAVSSAQADQSSEAAAKSATPVAKSDTKPAVDQKPLTAEQAAVVARAQAVLKKQLEEQLGQAGSVLPDAEGKSFSERLTGLFSSNKVEEPEKPRRMICKMHRGFKRCKFPKEK